MNVLPASWWLVLTLSGLGFALLWWVVRERHRAARIRAMKHALAQCGRAESPAEQTALDRLHDAPRAVPRRSAPVPTPRFLFLGDVPRMARTGFWHWTALPAMVAIAIDPQVVASPDAPPLRRAWHHALLALMQARRRVPLNGIVVCLDAQRLGPGNPPVQPEATRLRRLIDEAVDHLGLRRLPIYLVVTGLERLEGYAVVRDALPADVRAQVLGERIALDSPALPRDAFAAITAGLHALRMTLLRAHPAARDRWAVHAFVEAVRVMGDALDTVATTLFAQSIDGVDAQPWRGLYLTGTGAAGGDFSDDLYARFLPADEALATSTRRSGSAARRRSP
ncbi:type VI secretion system protein [Variovorax sp. PAMC 28711]|uniref:type VI secretion system protein n=1 Tax=Variovorax sp. PAMC 28711 TaxID=1795631 RepID=UPI00078DCF50|nr:type VI secretion system protein [Variovorax sp. PAMC 28711]AMM25122.1 hypothetical protein AX767_12660 [Variovorax sp. PAMC 28711]